MTEFNRARWGIWKQREELSAANLDRKPKDFQAPLHQRVIVESDTGQEPGVCNICDCCPQDSSGFTAILTRETCCDALGAIEIIEAIAPGVWRTAEVVCPTGGVTGRFVLDTTGDPVTLTSPAGTVWGIAASDFFPECGNKLDLISNTNGCDVAPCVCMSPHECVSLRKCTNTFNCPFPESLSLRILGDGVFPVNPSGDTHQWSVDATTVGLQYAPEVVANPFNSFDLYWEGRQSLLWRSGGNRSGGRYIFRFELHMP